MNSLKLGIIEDDLIIAQSITEMLEELGYQVTAPARKYSEAIAMLNDEQPDLLLIDVRLQGKLDGIDVAHYVKDNFRLPFIFLTANSDAETIKRAKVVKPFAFLSKPVTQSQLYAAIEIAMDAYQINKEESQHATSEKPEAIIIKDASGFIKLKYSEIDYVMSEENYVKVVLTDQRKVLVRTTFTDFLQLLDADRIVRVHRSYAVSIDKIDKFHNNELKIGSLVIPVSKTYKEFFVNKVKV